MGGGERCKLFITGVLYREEYGRHVRLAMRRYLRVEKLNDGDGGGGEHRLVKYDTYYILFFLLQRQEARGFYSSLGQADLIN
jgi:hypothetical protein